MKTFAFFTLIVLAPLLQYAQSANEIKQAESRFNIELGAIERVTIFYLKGTNGFISGPAYHGRAPYPYTYLKGVNGGGLNLDLNYNVVPNFGLSIHVFGNLRYDHYKWSEGKNIQTIYFDQGAFLTKSIIKKAYIGSGYTIYNIGKELRYTNGGKDWILPLEFNSLNFLIGFPVWKIMVEPKISIVYKDFPGTVKDNATILSLRVYYKLIK